MGLTSRGSLRKKSDPRFTVFFYPGYKTPNPYWDLLAGSIASSYPDINIHKTAIWHFDFAKIFERRTTPVLIHIHWVREYMRQFPSPLHLLGDIKSYAAIFAHFAIMTYMKIFRRATIIHTVHDIGKFNVRPTWTSLFSKWVIALSDAYIFHCKFAEEDFFKTKRRKPSFVIPHATYAGYYGPIVKNREEARQILGLPKECVALLIFGYIRQSKNLRWLLRQLTAMPHTNIRFVIAGHPIADSTVIERYAHDQRFIFIPRFIVDWQIRWLMSASDFMINAQTRGYTSGATVTALSYGLPVIQINWGCTPNMVKHGINGFLFSPNDPDSLYRAMDNAIKIQYDPKAYGGMRQNTYKSMQDEGFAWTSMAKNTVDAYIKTLNHNVKS